MIKTFTAMEQNPNRATGQATDEANNWLQVYNDDRAVKSLVKYKWHTFTTTMTLVPGPEGNPDWFVFTITATYGV